MTPLERAQVYADIFFNAEEDWEHYIPADAARVGDTVVLGSVFIERSADGWRLMEATP